MHILVTHSSSLGLLCTWFGVCIVFSTPVAHTNLSATVCTFIMPLFKVCQCGKKFYFSDPHESCLRCLGGLHTVDDCTLCKSLSNWCHRVRDKARFEFIMTGVWPDFSDFFHARDQEKA